MEKVQESVSLPAESKAVKDLVVAIVADLKAGKSVAEVGMSHLVELEKAVAGYSALPEEVKDADELVLAGLMVGQVLKALKG